MSIIEAPPMEKRLELLQLDLAQPGPVMVYAYLIDPNFFLSLFAERMTKDPVFVLADHHQKKTLQQLQSEQTNLHFATWAKNRTMHSKTILLPRTNVVYFTSANLTRGAWSHSINSLLRVKDAAVCQTLASEFDREYLAARRHPRRQTL